MSILRALNNKEFRAPSTKGLILIGLLSIFFMVGTIHLALSTFPPAAQPQQQEQHINIHDFIDGMIVTHILRAHHH